MLAAAGIPEAAEDTPAKDSTNWDSTDSTVDTDSMVVEEAGADSVRGVLREYVPVPVQRQDDRKDPADTSDEWATYCRTARL